ncbi:MAG: hypothetical protein ACJ8F7_18270 [Gemmataceae bacterium]
MSSRHNIVRILVCLIVFVPACGRGKSQNERLQAQWNARCKEAANLLAGIQDVPSARAAEPKLKSALQEMEKINKELGKTYDSEDVDPSDSRGMTQEVAGGIGEMQRLSAETLRISKHPELIAALGETWRKLPSVFMLEATGAIPKSK